ncbi:glycosyltransferase [Idiomarina sp.]|uniref:glycosyltransferase family 2 protein n=1 Tax=Idiomarina sp. TaxID=1874361 RepID=UPI0025B895C1|nr:glycosyltransferase [Idiomarina sp.]NQZ04545.1 glycosyltransferase family 2 protein [Idiomarina sp.]
MPKSLIRKVLRKIRGEKSHQAKDAFINIDFATSASGELILLGWMKKSQLSSTDLQAFDGNIVCNAKVFTYSRDDVAAHFDVSSTSDVQGFLAIINAKQSSMNKLRLVLGDRTVELSKHRFQVSRTVDQLLNHIGAERSSAVAFLKKHHVELDTAASEHIELKSARPLEPDVEKIKNYVSRVNLSKSSWVDDCQREVLPAIQKIWKARQSSAHAECLTYGRMPENPRCSVVVPLYGRYDFMQFQLSAFSADEAMKDIELIYVLDDPMLDHEVRVTAHGLSQTFSMPFKVVYLDKNLGFAGANNQGAAFASSHLLLMLNSDILPTRSGWLTDLCKQFDSLNSPGILGATLIYEDESVQHCGMQFTTEPNVPGIYLNHHPYKGVPVALLDLPNARPVLLTTGACMLMRTDLYRELGGFDDRFVIGDFEDSDLCMKFAAKGYQNYVSGTVKLFHLERLSQGLVSGDNWKQKLTFANAAYQHQKWNDSIDTLIDKYDSGWQA